MHRTKHRRAFSLVELSIVLVILGLLIGGILAGKALIRASELRAVGTEYQRYLAATYSFKDKYFGWPGDITNATDIWGKDTTSSAACAGQSGTAATPGTCNGNGNGIWGLGGGDAEGYRAWQHLALAGLIEGNYNGTITTYLTISTLGADIPASKLAPAGWTFTYLNQLTNGELNYSDLPSISNRYLYLGRPITAWANNAVLRSEDAWNIDTKLDDGRPAFGKIRANASCTDASVSTANYAPSATGIVCAMGFMIF